MDQLKASLLDLLYELDGKGIPITVGGGFGLYLKRQHLQAAAQRMLFDQLPEPRVTNDLDLFFRTEVLVDIKRTRDVANAILRLGYTPVETAKFLQWTREIVVAGVPMQVKIDILVGPLGNARTKLHVKKIPRVRPKEPIDFHAHTVEEAISIEDDASPVEVVGTRTTGEPYSATVLIPQAFPYLMMKLHAFDDRRMKAERTSDQKQKQKERDKERQHALDLYAIVGMMTEEEFNRALALGAAHAASEHVRRACEIVNTQFGSLTARGLLSLREHPLFRDEFETRKFLEVLRGVFPES